MVRAEKAFKWGIAIIVIFGILNAFYFLNLVTGLKIALPILCVFMIGSILLQSGKGGGLASIGGLGDQAAFGTRTSTFLTKVTYLIGAAFIVATIFLFKLSIPTRAINTITTHETSAQHAHDHEHGGEHDHGDVPHSETEVGTQSQFGMQNVAEEQPSKPIQEGQNRQAMKDEETNNQSIGMNSVDEKKQSSGMEESPTTGE
jgi:protein translocase SecG subunit